MNVTDHRCQILVRIDENGFVATAKKRAIATMAPIESLGVDPINMAHDPREIPLRRSKTEVIMVTHQRIGKNFDSPAPMGFGHGVEKRLIVSVVCKRWLLRPSSVHNVIDGLGKLNSEWT